MTATISAPTSVYRYYDQYGVLLYVGITDRGTERNREHNRDKDWWVLVSRQEVDHHPDRASALTAEAALIRKHQPPFNTQHNPNQQASQEMYFRFRTFRHISAFDIYQNLEWHRRLPLDVVPGDQLRFRSRLSHAALVSSLYIRGNVRVSAVGFELKTVVHELIMQGPLAIITCTRERPLEHPSTYALAELRWDKERSAARLCRIVIRDGAA